MGSTNVPSFILLHPLCWSKTKADTRLSSDRFLIIAHLVVKLFIMVFWCRWSSQCFCCDLRNKGRKDNFGLQ